MDKTAKYKTGDKVIYTNPQGVNFGERTVLRAEFWERDYGNHWRYFISDSDTPWYPVCETCLTLKTMRTQPTAEQLRTYTNVHFHPTKEEYLKALKVWEKEKDKVYTEAKNAAKFVIDCHEAGTKMHISYLNVLEAFTIYPPLRSIKVTYSNGTVIDTEMAAHLTDEQMKEYFAIGRFFNIGSGVNDLMAAVTKTEILN